PQPPPRSLLLPYTTLFRSLRRCAPAVAGGEDPQEGPARELRVMTAAHPASSRSHPASSKADPTARTAGEGAAGTGPSVLYTAARSEEHTSELQSRFDLVCR